MINKETLDYVDLTILKFENTNTMDEVLKTDAPSIQPENGKLQKSTVNHSFKKEELDQLIVHQRLASTNERKIVKI